MTQEKRFEELEKRIKADNERNLSLYIIANGKKHAILVRDNYVEFACCITGMEKKFDETVKGNHTVISGPLMLVVRFNNLDTALKDADFF